MTLSTLGKILYDAVHRVLGRESAQGRGQGMGRLVT